MGKRLRYKELKVGKRGSGHVTVAQYFLFLHWSDETVKAYIRNI